MSCGVDNHDFIIQIHFIVQYTCSSDLLKYGRNKEKLLADLSEIGRGFSLHYYLTDNNIPKC